MHVTEGPARPLQLTTPNGLKSRTSHGMLGDGVKAFMKRSPSCEH
jgi:hypothetical protein